MPALTDVERALVDGARRSRMACSMPANDSFAVRVWRRHKFKIIGAILFILLDLIGLSGLASNSRGHF